MTVRLAAVFLALAVTSAMAQPTDVPEPPEPPPGTNAWSLRVHTSGGFTGRGAGSVTISSDGRLGCASTPCETPLLERFGKAIVSAVAEPWGWPGPSSICSDCIRTTIVLKRRDGDVVRVYRASWDDSQSVAPQLRELRRLALELRAAR